jgi:hypothetical protein
MHVEGTTLPAGVGASVKLIDSGGDAVDLGGTREYEAPEPGTNNADL